MIKKSDWIIIHSQDIIKHQRSKKGEIDYIVIIPKKGIVCIEVKSCKEPYPIINDKGWVYKYGALPNPDGPFVQVNESMESLRSYLVNISKDLRDIIFTRLVIFTDSPFDLASSEWERWEYADTNDLGKNKENIYKCILNTIDQFRKHCEGKNNFKWFSPTDTLTPSNNQVVKVVNILRPHYENFLTPEKRKLQLHNEILHYSKDQFLILDAFKDNNRILVNSPAGTGKTNLAIEAARRSNDRGEKTLFICFNKLLGNELKKELNHCNEFVVFKRFYQLLLEVAGINLVENSNSFWNKLPEKAIDKVKEHSYYNYFDHLIIDEAQDLLNIQNIIFLSELLSTKLSESRLTIFGDFDWQSLYREDIDSNDLITPSQFNKDYCTDLVIFSPRSNYRNTPAIAKQAELLGSMNPGYSDCKRPDDNRIPEIKFFANDEEQISIIFKTIEKLLIQKFKLNEITILSQSINEKSIINKINNTKKNSFLLKTLGIKMLFSAHP